MGHPSSEGYCLFWEHIDKVICGVGFNSIRSKFHLPGWLMLFLGWLCELLGACTGTKLKLSRFSVRMLLIHRWFKIDAVQRDLGYEPIVGFDEGWTDTIAWFRERWLPHFGAGASGLAGGIARQTQHKIDLQAGANKTSANKHD